MIEARADVKLMNYLDHIADRIRVSWANLVTTPWFSLHNAVFYQGEKKLMVNQVPLKYYSP